MEVGGFSDFEALHNASLDALFDTVEKMKEVRKDAIYYTMPVIDGVLLKSPELHRPRGFYCAIGNCASCQMVVDGEPNVRTCITLLKEGMRVETQDGKGRIE